MSYNSILLIFFLLSTGQVTAQDSTEVPAPAKESSWAKKLLYKMVIDTSDVEKKSFRIYPTIAYAPETSFEFGFSSLYLFRAKDDPTNRLSEISAFTFITLEKQYGFWADNAIYLDKDKWFFLGRTRLQHFPLLYYGIGPHANGKDPAVVDANYILLRQRALRKLIPNLFIGPEIDYQLLAKPTFRQPDNHTYPLPEGATGTSNWAMGVALVYDDRHNVLNVRKGLFAELSFLKYSRSLGSNFSFHNIYTDVRSYHPVGKRDVWAWQVTGNFLRGDIPFNQLSMMGGDMMMRGYYQGRYRDKHMIAAQTEYRLLPFAFSSRVGGSLFTSAAVVAPRIGSFALKDIRFAAGGGLRYLLFPKKDIYLRFDVGFTREGPGFYIMTGEAF
ncbi:MAG: BamA/TamA family outer membrane protein [Chitinophagaceae bacterium]|nr:BamA/TamA family outer membrane protein [Chitinophagaceae bacterium]MCW5928519.1 BamA/TamA family outer membrane protein [Chitinophagaceae bacterium]